MASKASSELLNSPHQTKEGGFPHICRYESACKRLVVDNDTTELALGCHFRGMLKGMDNLASNTPSATLVPSEAVLP